MAYFLPSLADITIHDIRYWFLFSVFIAFLVTLILELPFFWFSLRAASIVCIVH